MWDNTSKILFSIIVIVGVIALVLGVYAFFTWLFMIVWNAVLPDVFGWKVINFWQAAGIVFILGFIGKAVTTKK